MRTVDRLMAILAEELSLKFHRNCVNIAVFQLEHHTDDCIRFVVTYDGLF